MNPRTASEPAPSEALHRQFTFAELRPHPHEVGVVLGYPGGEVPEVVLAAIDQVAAHGEALWSIEGGCVVVPEVSLDRSAHVLRARGLEFQVGKIVGGQLSRSTALAVCLCTAGKGIEQLSRGLMAGGDPFTGYVADTLGSLVVEAAMDRLQDAIAEELGGHGLRITNRYSPGYCGWHVSEQQKVFRLFPAGYCGVSLTDTSLMRPIKTVSGFIGVGPEVRRLPYTCKVCEFQDCLYRRRGEQKAHEEGHG
jgi:hypothetical protein